MCSLKIIDFRTYYFLILFILGGLNACSDETEVPMGGTANPPSSGSMSVEMMCPEGQLSCEQQCVDAQTNILHCGACGNVCPVGTGCLNGICGCADGLTLCQNQCVDLNRDGNHCGGCGISCLDDQICMQSMCLTLTAEDCNGIDDDLDGSIDEGEDGNVLKRSCDNLCGQGSETCRAGEFTACSAPTPFEETCNLLDDDCDGVVDEGVTQTFYLDADLDSYGSNDVSLAVQACTDPGMNYVDRQGDCDDSRNDVYPGHPELCDEIDHNCNQTPNEGCGCVNGEEVACGVMVGECRPGIQTCMNGELTSCRGANYVGPTEELCDQLDNDCDAVIDEELSADIREGNNGNDICERAHSLSDLVDSGASQVIQNTTLYQAEGSDVDWYQLAVYENDSITDVINYAFCLGSVPMELADLIDFQQCHVLNFEFVLPSNLAQNDIEVCVYFDASRSCSLNAQQICSSAESYQANSHSHTFSFKWPGICGFEDRQNFNIEVRGTHPNVNSCQAYQMRFGFDQVDLTFCQ